MTKTEKKILWIGGAGLLALLVFMAKSYIDILKLFLPQVEGFSATPYWDYKQWSWGYGTRVPGSSDNRNIRPTGTITRAKAIQDALSHVANDYKYLAPLVHVKLNAKQWAALLSFSYNLGSGNADNLITNINNRNYSALESQWKSYIYAGGQVNPDLVDRREKEWNLFTS